MTLIALALFAIAKAIDPSLVIQAGGPRLYDWFHLWAAALAVLIDLGLVNLLWVRLWSKRK